MSFDALPHEIVELIIDNIAAKPKDYREYALVSRAWLTRCRHHGFRTITLSSVNDYELPRSIAESIGPFVQGFIVDTSSVDTKLCRDMRSCQNTALLTNLERVTIVEVQYTDKVLLLHQSLLTAIRGNAPVITMSYSRSIKSRDVRKYLAPLLCEAHELYLTTPFQLDELDDLDQAYEPDLWTTSPQAKHLTLRISVAPTIEIFADMFLITAGPIRLRSLFIDAWCSQWQEVVRNLGPSLEHLFLLLPYHHIKEFDTRPDTFVDLSASSGLKSVGYEFVLLPGRTLMVPALFTVPSDITVKFLIQANGVLDRWRFYTETIERLAATHPQASFQVYNFNFDPGPGETGETSDPTPFMQQYFPELHRIGRLTHMPKGLPYYTPSDLD